MRPLILLVFCATLINSSNAYAQSVSMTGTWIPVKQEIGGTALPPSAFKDQKLVITDSGYTLIAESIDKGVVKINENKMDIYSKEGVNAGRHFTAIYKYNDGELTICYNLAGDSYPQSFDTNGKPAYFMAVFRRDTEQ